MTREEARIIREEVMGAVATVLERHGMVGTSSSITYGDADGKVSISFSAGTSAAEARTTSLQRDWDTYAPLLRLEKAWLGTTVNLRGYPMTIVGLNPSNRKYPVIVEGRGGKRYKVGTDVIRLQKGLPESTRPLFGDSRNPGNGR